MHGVLWNRSWDLLNNSVIKLNSTNIKFFSSKITCHWKFDPFLFFSFFRPLKPHPECSNYQVSQIPVHRARCTIIDQKQYPSHTWKVKWKTDVLNSPIGLIPFFTVKICGKWEPKCGFSLWWYRKGKNAMMRAIYKIMHIESISYVYLNCQHQLNSITQNGYH